MHNLKHPLFNCTLNNILKQTTLIEIIKQIFGYVLPEKHDDGLLITRSSVALMTKHRLMIKSISKSRALTKKYYSKL